MRAAADQALYIPVHRSLIFYCHSRHWDLACRSINLSGYLAFKMSSGFYIHTRMK